MDVKKMLDDASKAAEEGCMSVVIPADATAEYLTRALAAVIGEGMVDEIDGASRAMAESGVDGTENGEANAKAILITVITSMLSALLDGVKGDTRHYLIDDVQKRINKYK